MLLAAYLINQDGLTKTIGDTSRRTRDDPSPYSIKLDNNRETLESYQLIFSNRTVGISLLYAFSASHSTNYAAVRSFFLSNKPFYSSLYGLSSHIHVFLLPSLNEQSAIGTGIIFSSASRSKPL